MPSVILSHTPSDVIRYLLISEGAGVLPSNALALPTDWKVFVSELPEEPNDLIALSDIGGLKGGRIQVDGEVQEHYGIDLLVRGTRLQSISGYTRTFRKIMEVCMVFDQQVRNTVVTIGDSTYTVHSMTKSGLVRSQGKDNTSNQRFIFTTTYLASIVEEL